MIAVLEALWDYLVEDLFNRPDAHQTKPLFNPYSGSEPTVDCPTAAQIRRQNLYNYLASFEFMPGLLVIGESPGWRGCRFSGVPFTSEAQLTTGQLGFDGTPSSQPPRLFTESSATTFWHAMRPYHSQFLAWNSLPLHPHHPNLPLSNRRVSMGEVWGYSNILTNVIDILRPGFILSVGRTAQQVLKSLGIASCYVRHPSHGGAVKFNTGVLAFFSKMGLDPSCTDD